MKELVIIGAGDFGREVAWLVEGMNRQAPAYRVLGYLDDDEGKVGQDIEGHRVLGKPEALRDAAGGRYPRAVIAMQDGDARRRIAERIAVAFPDFDGWETLIHPSAVISSLSRLGKGCVVCANVSVSVNTIVGAHGLFNIAAGIGHDCVIGDYVSVMSGARVCGRVTVGDGAYLATNSTVVPGMKVGARATVGAGSVVLRDVKDGATVMGVPARAIF